MQTSIWAIGSTSKRRDAGGGRWDLQKYDFPIKGREVNCKITQSPMPLGYWSGGPDWNLHCLHREVCLHLIYSQIENTLYQTIYLALYFDETCKSPSPPLLENITFIAGVSTCCILSPYKCVNLVPVLKNSAPSTHLIPAESTNRY